jgi:hypothetical protein
MLDFGSEGDACVPDRLPCIAAVSGDVETVKEEAWTLQGEGWDRGKQRSNLVWRPLLSLATFQGEQQNMHSQPSMKKMEEEEGRRAHEMNTVILTLTLSSSVLDRA